MSVSTEGAIFNTGDLAGFRAHKVDAIIFTVGSTVEIQGIKYLVATTGLHFLATECRVIKSANTAATKRPPLGLCPKKIHDANRALDIISAMERYVKDDKAIPMEWIGELSNLYGAS